VPQYYLIPKRVARAAPAISRAAQWLEAGAFRIAFWLLRRLSFERASGLAASLFALIGPRLEKAGKVRANLAIAFPDMTEAETSAMTREIFRSLGLATVELIKMPLIWKQWEERIELVVDPASVDYLASSSAGVYVTAHVGPWQMAPIPLIRHYFGGRPMALVFAPESNPRLQALMLELRSAISVDAISSEAGLRPLLKALNSGQSLALAVDTRLRTGKLVPFFGVDALTNISPARMALRTGTRLVPVHAERLGIGRFRITVQAPIEPSDPDAEEEEKAIDMTRQLNEVFEDWIRQAPEQWMCLKRRWPKAHRL
jgi:KDO2-lipid IV(A) lauroyltransferase